MKQISDACVKRMADLLAMLVDELEMARMLPRMLSEPTIVRNTTMMYSISNMARLLDIRENVLAHIKEYDVELHRSMVLTFNIYDEYHDRELKAEMQGEPVDLSEAEAVIQSILKK